ncbi:MAG: ABC transporter ATP-binding protein [Candidatus Aenigmarchaeota archaeon]|nr:ABC transporter ATP-binding protein [Candidatus Aenigmarchaeota archaeon]
MKPESAIKTENLHKTFRLGNMLLRILRGISLEIKHGEFVSIMGPSGSGKSTLMHILGCLDRPSIGHVYIGGEKVSLMEDDELAFVRGRKIGFVFQFYHLIPSLSVLRNVMLPTILNGLQASGREKKALEALQMVGLEKRKDFMPNQLSGGERQRVAIARALVNEPEIILADEPTGNLDSKNGKEIIKLLKDLNEKKKITIVLITHDSNIAALARRHIYIKDGKIERDTGR